MKTKDEKIENIKRLIKRKESIRVKHLLVINKHLKEVDKCEEYIKNYKKALESFKNSLLNKLPTFANKNALRGWKWS